VGRYDDAMKPVFSYEIREAGGYCLSSESAVCSARKIISLSVLLHENFATGRLVQGLCILLVRYWEASDSSLHRNSVCSECGSSWTFSLSSGESRDA
jgi:hypothetical protein